MDKKLKAYQTYRQGLKAQNIGSFIDQNDRTYTTCTECTKASCKGYREGNGCMIGTVKESVAVKIVRG
jgi:hypothetical protein